MSEFLASYGLWLLIAILVVIVILFLLSGKKKGADAAIPTPVAAPRPDPVIAPEPEAPVPEIAVPETPAPEIPPSALVEPVILTSGPTPIVTTPIPETPVTSAPAAPTPAAEPLPVSPAGTSLPEGDDNLLLLKGVGPKLATLLGELGVTRFAQIAAWTDTDLATIDTRLGTFKGRPVRDQWIDQAKYLATGDTAGFEAKYGKL